MRHFLRLTAVASLLVLLTLPLESLGVGWGTLDPFLSGFEGHYTITVTDAPFEEQSDLSPNLQESFSSWRFRSREKVPGSNPPLFRRFRLRSYRFGDRKRSVGALAAFTATVGDSMFFKSPLFVI